MSAFHGIHIFSLIWFSTLHNFYCFACCKWTSRVLLTDFLEVMLIVWNLTPKHVNYFKCRIENSENVLTMLLTEMRNNVQVHCSYPWCALNVIFFPVINFLCLYLKILNINFLKSVWQFTVCLYHVGNNWVFISRVFYPQC